MPWNQWQLSRGMGGRLRLESVATLVWNTHHEVIRSLFATLERAGIIPADPNALLNQIADCQLIRFPTANKRRKKNGYLIAFFEGEVPNVVVAGDWSTNARVTWSSGYSAFLSKSERAALDEKMHRAREERKAERQAEQGSAAATASKIWNSAESAEETHPYLVRKQISPARARQSGNSLILDVRDFDGRLKSLQFIHANGTKKLLPRGAKQGHFIPVCVPQTPSQILICEGWATGCTLADLSPDALVLAAVDAGNLKAVATGARNHWPDAHLIICGDDDRETPGNPGATAAREAAIAAGAEYALPSWPSDAPTYLSDYNDLINWSGRIK
ncbi:toprim domain-containing protein [Marinobacter sp. DSM 26671]|uniref:toprim domain-containing protein n=1 Tax=Marinobacter sp. DSM 26671 TaxID=1761793 RepID=UPI000B894388|nr:toprim domain-containing protein [Marinobacter sp. DSM 26671]